MNYFEQVKLGESRWWSWIAVFALCVFSWFFFSIILTITLFAIAGALVPSLNEGVSSSDTAIDVTFLMGASPIAYLIVLLTFPVALIGLYFGQKAIHQRSLTSLHTAAKRFRVSRAIQGFFLTWIVLGLFSLIGNSLGIIDIAFVFNGQKFWIYALVSILFIPIQSATEEIVFRGHLNQGLSHLTKSKWIAFVVTSFIFMLMHLSNPEALEGAASGTLPIVMSNFFFGFAMCLIVWIDDGLETAIGIHAGNNCFAAMIVNYENSVLPTPSIFLTGQDPIKDAISTVLVLSVIIVITWFWRGGSKNHDP